MIDASDAFADANPPPVRGPVDEQAQAGEAGTLRACDPISSEKLLGSAREVQIAHRGTLYRLKLTALGKLILTK